MRGWALAAYGSDGTFLFTVPVLLEPLEVINLSQPVLRRVMGSCSSALLVCWETVNAAMAVRASGRGSLLAPRSTVQAAFPGFLADYSVPPPPPTRSRSGSQKTPDFPIKSPPL